MEELLIFIKKYISDVSGTVHHRVNLLLDGGSGFCLAFFDPLSYAYMIMGKVEYVAVSSRN